MEDSSEIQEQVQGQEASGEYAYPLGPILDQLARPEGFSNYAYGRHLETAVMGYLNFRRSKGGSATFTEVLSSLKPNICATLIDFLTLNKNPNDRSDALKGIVNRRHKAGDPLEMIPQVMEAMDRITVDQMLSPGEKDLREALAVSMDRELVKLREARTQGQLLSQGRSDIERYTRLLPQLRAVTKPAPPSK